MHVSRRTVINLLAIGLLLYIVIPASAGLGDSMQVIAAASYQFVALAAGSIALSYCFAALTYRLLVLKPVGYWPILCVQVAGGFVNRLLPAGLGGLGLNALFLKKRKHSYVAATAVVGVNNSLGAIGNVLLLGVAIVLSPAILQAVSVGPRLPRPGIILAGCAGLFIGLLLLVRTTRLRRAVGRFASDTLAQLRLYGRKPGVVLLALLSSMMLTALHAAGLFFVGQSLGLTISPHMALLAISLGAFVGAAVPTPGGLGGAEAGITAALVALGIPASAALGAAILYRTLTFWAPLLPGFLMFRFVQKKYL